MLKVFLALLAPFSVIASCPDLLSLRSPAVTDSFSASALEGFYYEQLYHDIAQIGSSCQTLNVTASDNDLSMDFSVKYGPIPFTIVEKYTSQDEVGFFIKNADMPGGQLISLPTVVVDVTTDENGDYDTMTLYSCLSLVGKSAVKELVVATRERVPDQSVVDGMVAVAKKMGVDVVDDVKAVEAC
jgi:hypothetical protein